MSFSEKNSAVASPLSSTGAGKSLIWLSLLATALVNALRGPLEFKHRFSFPVWLVTNMARRKLQFLWALAPSWRMDQRHIDDYVSLGPLRRILTLKGQGNIPRQCGFDEVYH